MPRRRSASSWSATASPASSPACPRSPAPAQSTYLTGRLPRDHGIVGNGWYDRDCAEHRFWKQSNRLVRGEKLWDYLRHVDPEFTCAKLFWWFNMYSTADFAITPRPLYPADGRKVFDIHTQPMGLRERIKKDLGDFPFPRFWGPGAGIKAPLDRRIRQVDRGKMLAQPLASSTCRISTTTCSATGSTSTRSTRRSARSTASSAT